MLPTLIRIGNVRLATYGMMVALGYLAGVLWLNSRRQEMGLSEKNFWNLIYALFFGAIAGGKILFWVIEWRAIADGSYRPIADFRFGFVFLGGLLGSIAMGWVYRRFVPIDYFKLADFFAVALPMGHAIGRLGCLAAGCCSGKPTSMPWGVRFTSPEALVDQSLMGIRLHPVQLYESIANACIALFTLRVLERVQKGSLPRGSAFLGYLALYSAARFVIEFFRGDDRGGFFLALSPAQWIGMALMSSSYVLYERRKRHG